MFPPNLFQNTNIDNLSLLTINANRERLYIQKTKKAKSVDEFHAFCQYIMFRVYYKDIFLSIDLRYTLKLS